MSPGFFGKLPGRGDFVGRRLAADFVEPWDAWLQGSIAQSRAALGGDWLDIYLTSPLWRFVLSPGVCGPAAHIGVVMPSVDNVGRYFPLAAAVPCGAGGAALADAARLDAWFGAVEDLLLATLAETPLELDVFDERLSCLVVADTASVAGDAPRRRDSAPESVTRRHLRIDSTDDAGGALLALCGDALDDALGPYSVWWTQGSQRMAPCALLSPGLPEPSAYIAMLDGRWSDRGWTSGELRSTRAAGTSAAAAPAAAPAVRADLRSAAVTDSGSVRTVNEDAFACRDDGGMWLVADGLGGHQSGDTASRMVAAALEHVDGGAALAERVEQLSVALRVVNGCLRELTMDRPAEALIASTVAALLVGEGTAVCVWAGDSRVYRFRRGELQQLSNDHGAAEDDAPDSRFVTRAVGGAAALQVEVLRTDLQHGDRYLLCTDGLYSEVSPERMAAALALDGADAACAQLKEDALRGAARDNLTAVVVHVGDAIAATAVAWP